MQKTVMMTFLNHGIFISLLFGSKMKGNAHSPISRISQKRIVDKTLIRRNSLHLVIMNKSLKTPLPLLSHLRCEYSNR